jgi:predicted dehydrogenase
MCHQIDTVHWFTGLKHPRSVVANGGIYMWQDGRENADTLTAVFDYGPLDDPKKGFQVVYSSRMHNDAGGVKEIYYSNGGELNLDTNKVSSNGGLTERYASVMGLKPFQLPNVDLTSQAVRAETAAATGEDAMTSAHVRNWLECVRSGKAPNAPVEAGYSHAIATIMTNAAIRTKKVVTFDEDRQEVLAGGEVFQY